MERALEEADRTLTETSNAGGVRVPGIFLVQ
jgi:hypothetical protein